ncbi:hypothetical protein L0156_09570 [bacterium]|nr:hypothetical protein [bacterium]
MTDLLRSFGLPGGTRTTNIRMSKLDRLLEGSRAKANWIEMAKMLFWSDNDERRQEENGKFISPEGKLFMADMNRTNQRGDQLRYLLHLIIIVAIAEKRTQEIYERDFSERCDRISEVHSLNDSQFWDAEEVPEEWVELNVEFEKVANQMLIGTLREYHHNEIADLVRDNDSQRIFQMIQDVQLDRPVEAL